MRLPIMSSRTMASILGRFGFTLNRTRGSHYIYRRDDGEEVMVPHRHTLARATVREIIRGAGITREAFEAMVRG